MLNVMDIKDPRWADEEHERITLMLLFEGAAEYSPFCASSYDCTDYGIRLFDRAVAGEFGEIGQYEKLDPAEEDRLIEEFERDLFFKSERRIATQIEDDWRLGLDVTDEEMKAVKLYLRALKLEPETNPARPDIFLRFESLI